MFEFRGPDTWTFGGISRWAATGMVLLCIGVWLEENLRHPSLRGKKYDESRNIWQARDNKDWRFYFLIRDDVYYIIDIIPHPK